MQLLSDVDNNETVADLGLVYWADIDQGDQGDISRAPFDNETGHHTVESLPVLKQSLFMVVIYTLAYSAVFILGVCGNALIVWLVCSNPQMRTVTNYFIVNLAIADILVCLFCLPITLLANLFSGWMYGAFLCKATPFLQGVSVSASVNTLMAIAFDRYLAICHGMRCHVTRKLARVTIALIWTFSATIMSPWAVFYQLRRYNVDASGYDADDSSMTTTAADRFIADSAESVDDKQRVDDNEYELICEQSWPSPDVERIYFLAAIFVTCYTIPLVCITACYIMIGHRVCNRHAALGTRGTTGSGGQTVIQRSKVKVVKMLVTVVVLFAVSWLPVYMVRLRLQWGPDLDSHSLEFTCLVQVIIPISQWLGSANSCVNPFIYCFFSHKFRAGFQRLLAGHLCRKRPTSLTSPSETGNHWRRRSTSRMYSFSVAVGTGGGNGMAFDHGKAIPRRGNVGGGGNTERRLVSSDERETSSTMPDVIVFSARARSDIVMESTSL